MSYEEISRKSRPCWCGKGTIVSVDEMDDWNRFRSWQIIECPACRADDAKRQVEATKKEARRDAARKKAKKLAKARYLVCWLRQFDGLSKKGAWSLLTNQGRNYPSLGTFYSQLKHYGSISDYLRWSFDQDFEGMMKRAGINDQEIEQLLREAENGSR
jgi:hypothetical protein